MSIKKLAKDKHARKTAKSTPASKKITNRAGGEAFDIETPALKLLTMTGGAFFSEPGYYSEVERVRNTDGKVELEAHVQGIESGMINFLSTDGLDSIAKEVIETAVAVAESDEPRDLLRLAVWLRQDMNIRLTPQVLLVLASQHPNTREHIADFSEKIIVRPDEVKTCILLHEFFFGSKSRKAVLDRALNKAMNRFGEKGLMKYDNKSYPTWKDVLCMLSGRRKGFPLSKELAEYFIKGTVSQEGTPVAYARKQLMACEEFDATARDWAKTSKVNWEVLSSKFGGTKDVWTFLLENKLVGYMAMLRNLRNVLQAGVDDGTIDLICNFLSNEENVKRSKQLPFRFLSAYNVVEGLYDMDSRKRSKLLSAIEDAMDASVENLPAMSGLTAIFHDTSGSMGSPVSGNSTVTCNMAGAMLAAICAKKCPDSYIGAFSTELKMVSFSKNDSIIAIAKKLMSTHVGYSTNTHKIMDWVIAKGIKPARIIITSDMQCYGRDSLDRLWTKFSKSDNGKECWMHSINLHGHGDTPIDNVNRVNLTAGFSEKILKQLLDAEVRNDLAPEGKGVSSAKHSLPSVEMIREMYE